jgi:hypothetical protein
MRALLMAIRARLNHLSAPAITLSAPFPATPHVGDIISFDVTATLVDGATGTLTITVDTLPAGLSLGSTSMVDSTHYKATVSGTLTTVQDVTSTFGATGGSVGSTPLVHAFNVQATASIAKFIQGNQANSASIAGGLAVTLTAAPTSGNQLFAIFQAGATAAIQTPTGWTPLGTCAGSNRLVLFGKVSDGSEQTTTFKVASGSPAMGAAVSEWSGAKAGTFTSSAAPQTGTSIPFGATDAPVSPNAIPLMFVVGTIAIGKIYTWSSGWTGTQGCSTTQYSNAFYAYEATPPGAAVSGTLGLQVSGSAVNWCNVWVEPK